LFNAVFFRNYTKPEYVRYTLLLIAFAISQPGFCQHADSIAAAKSHRFVSALAAPAIFITAGFVAKNHNESIQKYFYKAAGIEERGPKTPSNISDYTQFAPMGLVFIMTAMNKKGEHKFLKQVSLAVQSEALMIAMVRPLKHFTNERRPDGGPHSFPSGHTAQAFMAATFLHKEFGHKSIWYSIAGYTMATAVGTCRMMSNRHWASDVLVGAGIGILSTNLVYLMHKDKAPKLNLSAAPKGFYMSMRL
jgi:membrane-associated phospholipid phosphatase